VAVTFRVGVVKEAKAGRFRVVRVEGGRRGGGAVAVVGVGNGAQGAGTISDAFTEVSAAAASWSAAHPPARLEVRRHRDRIEVTASGTSALGGLTAFLSTLDLQLDKWGALAAFLGIAVGMETSGASLGIATRDPDGGATLSVTFLSLQESPAGPEARLDLHLPPRFSPSRLEGNLRERTSAFARRAGVPIELELEHHPPG
jgi:hypothetical protein